MGLCGISFTNMIESSLNNRGIPVVRKHHSTSSRNSQSQPSSAAGAFRAQYDIEHYCRIPSSERPRRSFREPHVMLANKQKQNMKTQTKQRPSRIFVVQQAEDSDSSEDTLIDHEAAKDPKSSRRNAFSEASPRFQSRDFNVEDRSPQQYRSRSSYVSNLSEDVTIEERRPRTSRGYREGAPSPDDRRRTVRFASCDEEVEERGEVVYVTRTPSR